VPGPQLRAGFFGTQTKMGLPWAFLVAWPLSCHPSGHGLAISIVAAGTFFFVMSAKTGMAIRKKLVITNNEIIILDMLPP
jgi:hypothetical protein